MAISLSIFCCCCCHLDLNLQVVCFKGIVLKIDVSQFSFQGITFYTEILRFFSQIGRNKVQIFPGIKQQVYSNGQYNDQQPRMPYNTPILVFFSAMINGLIFHKYTHYFAGFEVTSSMVIMLFTMAYTVRPETDLIPSLLLMFFRWVVTVWVDKKQVIRQFAGW